MFLRRVLQTRLMVTLGIVSICASISHACPSVTSSNLVDYNCDGKFKVVGFGDSIVRGIGDEEYNQRGSYLLRFKQTFPGVVVSNNGIPGISSSRALRLVIDTFGVRNTKRNRHFRYHWGKADLIIIGVGINDYWDGVSPATTANNIKRIADTLRKSIVKYGIKAQVLVATLTRTNRSFQQPFVDSVNSLLLQRSSRNFPVKLRFDGISTTLLNYDGLHPNSAGYEWMAEELIDIFENHVQPNMAKFHSDLDDDGIYDKIETKRFHTLPYLKDTDFDTIDDGDEVFVTFTDPLDPLDPTPSTSPSPESSPSPSPSTSPTPSPSASASPSASPSSSPSASPSPSPMP